MKAPESSDTMPGGRQRRSAAIVAGLVIFRIGIVGGTQLVLGTLPEWLVRTYDLVLYAALAILMVWEKASLIAFHIGRLSLAIFIFTGVLIGAGGDTVASCLSALVFVSISVCLARSMRSSFSQLPKIRVRDLAHLLEGAAVGVVLAILLDALKYMLLGDDGAPPRPPGSLLAFTVALAFVDQLGRAGSLEEPLFRGFLWGHLRTAGLKESQVLIAQAVLFAAAHLNYTDRPFTLLVSAPLAGLIFGLLAWHRRSVAPAMMAHAMYNAMGYAAHYFVIGVLT